MVIPTEFGLLTFSVTLRSMFWEENDSIATFFTLISGSFMSILQPVIRMKAAMSIKVAYMCQFMNYDIYSKYLRYSSSRAGFPDRCEEFNLWYVFIFRQTRVKGIFKNVIATRIPQKAVKNLVQTVLFHKDFIYPRLACIQVCLTHL